jgi:hypothetical protein
MKKIIEFNKGRDFLSSVIEIKLIEWLLENQLVGIMNDDGDKYIKKDFHLIVEVTDDELPK